MTTATGRGRLVMRWSKRSRQMLIGVHPDLVILMTDALAISPHDFGIVPKTGGRRTPFMQAGLVDSGASSTHRSNHIPRPFRCKGDGGIVELASAVDFYVWNFGSVTWSNHFYYEVYEKAIRPSAEKHGIKINWGGEWTSPHDPGHVELQRVRYPSARG